MKGERYASGQPQSLDLYTYESYAHHDSLAERWLDLFSPGVLRDSQLAGEASPFLVTAAVGLHINVGTGAAISDGSVDASDQTKPGGERIVIPDTDVTSGKVYRRDPGTGPGSGTGTGPFAESIDGLTPGGWVWTPQSTWTRSIPVVDNATNYVWLGYLRTIDAAVYSLHGVTTARIYPHGLDGYDLVVTQTNTPPVFALTGNNKYAKISVVVTAGGVITSITQPITWAATNVKRVAGALHANLKPSSYSIPSGASPEAVVSAEDHMNSFGSGVASPENPHATGIDELGYRPQDVDVRLHQKYLHTNGIIAASESDPNAGLYPRTDTATPTPGGAGMVFLKQLLVGEEAIVYGESYTTILPKLVAAVGGGKIGDAYIGFSTSDLAGLYAIFIADDGGRNGTVYKRPVLIPGVNPSELYICDVQWNGTAFVDTPPAVRTDWRKFGTISTKDIQVGSIVTDKIGPAAVTAAKLGSASVMAANLGSDVAGDGLARGAQGEITIALEAANPTLKTTASKETAVKYDSADFATSTNGLILADESVSTRELGPQGVTAAKMASDSVNSINIVDESVTKGKLSVSVQTQLDAINFIGNGVKSGLYTRYNTSKKVDVVADSLSVQGMLLSGVSRTADISADHGPGGLDVPGFGAPLTWYAVYIICKEDGTYAAMLSAGHPTPDLMPSGYTRYRRVGWVRTVASVDFIPFLNIGDQTRYLDPSTCKLDSTTTTPRIASGTNSFATWIPPTSIIGKFIGSASYNTLDQPTGFLVRTTGTANYVEVGKSMSSTLGYAVNFFEWATDSSQRLDLTPIWPSSLSSCMVVGYYDPV